MMISCCSLSALLSGNSSLSVLQSHLPPYYLGGGALSYLKSANWSWDLDLAISIGDDLLILLRSLGCRPGGFRAKMRQVVRRLELLQPSQMFSQVPRHHTLATSSPGQTPYNKNKMELQKNFIWVRNQFKEDFKVKN